MFQQRIKHNIANEMNLFLGNSLAHKIAIYTSFGREKDIGDAISQNPINFLRHGPLGTP